MLKNVLVGLLLTGYMGSVSWANDAPEITYRQVMLPNRPQVEAKINTALKDIADYHVQVGYELLSGAEDWGFYRVNGYETYRGEDYVSIASVVEYSFSDGSYGRYGEGNVFRLSDGQKVALGECLGYDESMVIDELVWRTTETIRQYHDAQYDNPYLAERLVELGELEFYIDGAGIPIVVLPLDMVGGADPYFVEVAMEGELVEESSLRTWYNEFHWHRF